MIIHKIQAALAIALFSIGFFAPPIIAYAESDVAPLESVEILSESIDFTEDEEVVEDSAFVENSADLKGENEGNTIIPETETSKWFDKYIVPIIVEYGTDILALGTTVCICLKKLKKAKDEFDTATAAVNESNENNLSTSTEVKKLQEGIEKWQREFAENTYAVFNRMEEQRSADMQRLVDALKETLSDKVEDIDQVVHKILDVQEIAYISNTSLVGNGAAKKISEVIKNE